MINRTGFRNLLESRCGGNRVVFERRVRHLMGLEDRNGRPYRDPAGNRVLRDPVDDHGKPLARLKPGDIPMRALNESLLGEEPERAVRMVPHAMAHRELMEAEGRDLLEDTGAGAVGPSAFANINAWTGVASGLLEVGILQAYQNPEYIADTLAPVEPSRQIEGRKTIGASRVGDQAEERLPGMPTKRIQIGERWITQPRTVENAVAAELLWETVFLDITGGQVAEHANDVGDWLAYRKELRCIDSFIGVVQSYNYKGTTYNTYISGGYYDNDITSGNELLYIDNVQAVEIKFRDMTDPDIGTRIRVSPNTLLVNQEKLYTASILFGGDEAQYRSAPGATSGEQSFRKGPNPIKGKYQIVTSPLVYQRMTDSTGLNLSASAAGKCWIAFEAGPRTHVYVQNQPLTTVTAAQQGNVDMIDRNVVLYVKAWERGVPMWKDPRRACRSKA